MFAHIFELIVVFWAGYLIYAYILDIKMSAFYRALLSCALYVLGYVIPAFLLKDKIDMGVFFYWHSILAGCLIPVFCLEKRKWSYTICWFLIYQVLSTIITAIFFLTDAVFEKKEDEVNNLAFVVTYIILLLLLCVLICVKRKMLIRNKGLLVLEKAQLIMIISGFFCSVLILDLLQFMKKLNDYAYADFLVKLFTVFAVYFLVISLWLWFTHRRNVEYRNNIEKYNEFIHDQERFIKAEIESDKNIRRIRHDMSSNINAMAALAQKGDDDELKKFIYKLKGMNDAAQVKSYSGNTTVDAVITGVINKYACNDACLKWNGAIDPECKVEIFDLCVIFSNLLSNAIEACDKGEFERNIDVSVVSKGENITIIMKNPTTLEDGMIPGEASDKEDRKNHGFGIKNVRDTLVKYNGRLTYKNENKMIYSIVVV